MTSRSLAALVLVALGATFPARAEDPEPADRYSVKVSLSREDPDVHRAASDADLIDFHVFVDGAPTRGAEFGIRIEGGTMVAYVIDTGKRWVTLPIEDPYPGTIAQVGAGADCFDPPVYFGRFMIRPDEPGAPVELHVIPSERAGQTAVLHCDNSGTYEILARHAAVNAEPRAPERLVSAPSKPGAPHPHHDHDRGGDPGRDSE